MRRKLRRAAGLLLHLDILPCLKLEQYFQFTAFEAWVHWESLSQRRLQHAIVDAAAAPQTWMLRWAVAVCIDLRKV